MSDALCSARCASDISRQRFRLPSAKYPDLPNNRTTMRKNAITLRVYFGGTHASGSETTGGVPSFVRLMEDISSCLARSSSPRRTLHTLELDSIQTTLQNSRASLRHCIFLDPQALSLAAHKLAFFFDSKHAANVCVGMTQTCPNVLSGMTSQQPLPQPQVRMRITIQHVHIHGHNVGNECTDHAAALGALGFLYFLTKTFTPVGATLPLTRLLCSMRVKIWKIFSKYLTRCVSFVCSSRFVSLVTPLDGTTFWLSRRRRVLFIFFLSQWGFGVTMDVSDTSTLTFSDPDELVEHDVWNPMFGLYCHADVVIFMEACIGR